MVIDWMRKMTNDNVILKKAILKYTELLNEERSKNYSMDALLKEN